MQATRVTKDEDANVELEKQQTRETKKDTNDMHSSHVSRGTEIEDGSPHKINWIRGSANIKLSSGMDQSVLKFFWKQSVTHNRDFLHEVWHEEYHCLLHDVLMKNAHARSRHRRMRTKRGSLITERSPKSTKVSRSARDDFQHNVAVQWSNMARVRLDEGNKGTQVKVNMTESDKERSTKRWCKQRSRRRTRMRTT